MPPRRGCPFCVVGFIPIHGSNSGKKPVAGPTVEASRSGSPIKKGGRRTRITFALPIRGKRQSTERALTTCASTASSIPTTCGATQLPSENGREKLRQAPVSHTSSDPPLTAGAERTSDQVSQSVTQAAISS
jgi:hypothetical protein